MFFELFQLCNNIYGFMENSRATVRQEATVHMYSEVTVSVDFVLIKHTISMYL